MPAPLTSPQRYSIGDPGIYRDSKDATFRDEITIGEGAIEAIQPHLRPLGDSVDHRCDTGDTRHGSRHIELPSAGHSRAKHVAWRQLLYSGSGGGRQRKRHHAGSRQ